MKDAHVIPTDAKLHVTKRGREELMATAEAEFDTVIGELQAMRRRFVDAGDHESLGVLAGNLQAETW
jgi:hypothetical protein